MASSELPFGEWITSKACDALEQLEGDDWNSWYEEQSRQWKKNGNDRKRLLTFLAAFGKFQVLMTSGIISLVDTWLISDVLISVMLISEM